MVDSAELERFALTLSGLNRVARMDSSDAFIVTMKTCPYCVRFEKSGNMDKLVDSLTKHGYNVKKLDTLSSTEARSMLRTTGYTKVPALITRQPVVRNMCHTTSTLYGCSANHDNLLAAISTGPRGDNTSKTPNNPRVVRRVVRVINRPRD